NPYRVRVSRKYPTRTRLRVRGLRVTALFSLWWSQSGLFHPSVVIRLSHKFPVDAPSLRAPTARMHSRTHDPSINNSPHSLEFDPRLPTMPSCWYLNDDGSTSVAKKSTAPMCCEVQYVWEYSCTHQWAKSRALVDCMRSTCAMSRRHTPTPHNCQTTCSHQ
ncbi:hypothetical protein B0H14DRAFT_2932077, partial [Mycena olivaceomarginata]